MEERKYLMPIPAGTPYSIIAEAVNKFGIEIVEVPIKEAMLNNENPPMMWALKGNYENLIKAKEFIRKRLEEVLKKFE
ncbi:MAG: hypothetical protein NZ922_03150 [Candidatus Methanomethyliaceae archaeon]|nr:hypothetical protein [Candidatus Methanomethyliaceae archaeon]MDW7970860.1 hypothetical protein [Nitrososphaerota archaeon]